MSAAKKARTSARGWGTRASNNLDKMLKVPTGQEVDLVKLQDAVNEFDMRLTALDAAQEQFEVEIEEEKELLLDIEKAADYREHLRKPRVAAAVLLAADVKENLLMSIKADSASSQAASAKLPKLVLPHFSGDVLKWTEFWEQFEAMVHNSDMPDVSKFTYLLSLVRGEAKATIQGLSLNAANYKSACELLKTRFGREEKIRFSHIQELLSISVSKNAKVGALWEMYNKLQSHIRCLASLKVQGTQYGVVLVPLVLSRLPCELRLEWARLGEGKEADLEHLLTFFKKEIERRERSQTFNGESSEAKILTHTDTKLPTAAALHTSTSGQQCALCESKGHHVDTCFKITKVPVGERREILSQKPLCFKCLQGRSHRHKFKTCNKRCKKCNGLHHLVLCESVPGSGASGGQGPRYSNTQYSPHSNTNTQYSGNSPHLQTGRQTGNFQHSQQAGHQFTASQEQHNRTQFTGVAHSDLTHPQTGHVLLQAARVRVRGEAGTAEAVVIFDTGSDRSYISERMVNLISPDFVCNQQVSYAAFGNSRPGESQLRNLYQVSMLGENQVESIVLTEIPVVCAPMYRPAVPPEVLEALGADIQLVDVQNGHFSVDILIGLDSYWRLMTPDMRSLSGDLMAQKTIFGWILSGALSSPAPGGVGPSNVFLCHQLLCINEVSDSTVSRQWELESIGVSCDLEAAIPDPVLAQFHESVDMSEGRYVVSLPWKSEMKEKLMSNQGSAVKRLDNLARKLSQDPQLEDRYNAALKEMEQAGIIHEVPVEELSVATSFYMPHRPVVRESSVSTKVRPIFDCSAKGPNGVSLNDCLETGPCMLASLVEILMRFRRWVVAVIADIQKAFLMIKVDVTDRDVHRFLWHSEGRVRVMRFDRVPFGNTSSPFLLMATVRYHLSKYPTESNVVKELEENMYMDDWLSGADDDSEACEMFQDADSIMSEAQMTLAKLGSSSEVVSEMLQKHFEDKHLGSDSIKVLGLKWLPQSDCFVFGGVDVPPDLLITKRVVLSFVSRLFDPLGFLNPFMIAAKILFQNLWKLGLQWDVPIPEELQQMFLSWIADLQLVKSWKIPRRYFQVPWKEATTATQFQLHAFGDASERAYGACVYLRVSKPDGSYSSSLVISKVKVAPLKTLTLPRLELMGSLLCARLLVFVRKALKLPDDVEYLCWTDSTVALAWIQGDSHQWKQFVGNRVAEIQSLTASDQWRHCPGTENPADLVTRGVSAEKLIHSRVWLHGPLFLETMLPDDSTVESSLESLASPEVHLEVKIEAKTLLSSSAAPVKVLDVERWSSFSRALRVVAWVLRFHSNLKEVIVNRLSGDLSFAELSKAKVVLLRSVQEQEYFAERQSLRESSSVSRHSTIFKLSPFVDQDGLLRVQGRLQLAGLSEAEKHPIIVPKGHISLLLARHVHVSQKHGGVNQMLVALRSQFWVVGARNTCKKVKRQCMSCQRQDAGPGGQCQAPLPVLRVTPAPAFSVTGVDHCGPLYCCDFPGRKFYVLLFTCAVVRAVHLELVEALSCEHTLYAVRRFIARRGMPSVIMSDNAKGFQAAGRQMVRSFGPEGPDWKFIVPRAPWWGGFWERMVKSVKSALRKSLGRKSLTRVELETSLHEVEACINSRPLTYPDAEADSSGPLTPSHFLLGRPSVLAPASSPGESELSQPDLRVRLEVRLQHIEHFWSIWKDQYIKNLPPCTGAPVTSGLSVGSLVLIHDENSYRLQWPLGVVLKLFPGRDGLVRSAEVKTAKNVLIRPIQRLYQLEANDELSGASLSPDNDTARASITHHTDTVTPAVTVDTNTQPSRPQVRSQPDTGTERADGSTRSRYGRLYRKTNILNL